MDKLMTPSTTCVAARLAGREDVVSTLALMARGSARRGSRLARSHRITCLVIGAHAREQSAQAPPTPAVSWETTAIATGCRTAVARASKVLLSHAVPIRTRGSANRVSAPAAMEHSGAVKGPPLLALEIAHRRKTTIVMACPT